MKTKTETRWVIVGKYGLYVGQHMTRERAICEHVSAKGVPTGGKDYPNMNPTFMVPIGKRALLDGWRYWYRKGDRAVKAKITYPVV